MYKKGDQEDRERQCTDDADFFQQCSRQEAFLSWCAKQCRIRNKLGIDRRAEANPRQRPLQKDAPRGLNQRHARLKDSVKRHRPSIPRTDRFKCKITDFLCDRRARRRLHENQTHQSKEPNGYNLRSGNIHPYPRTPGAHHKRQAHH